MAFIVPCLLITFIKIIWLKFHVFLQEIKNFIGAKLAVETLENTDKWV